MTTQTPKSPSVLAPVYVDSEWAELKECVYGSPDTWVLPAIYDDVMLRAQGEYGRSGSRMAVGT